MISLSVLSLLLLGAQAQDSCLQTPTQYMDHLKELLGGATSEIKPICDNVNLMTRIQGIPGRFGWDQETLNQYGGYWTFAGGVDVAERYLGFARDLQDKLEFAKAALYYVGFSANDIETNTNKQQLVVFDQAKMDSEWLAGTPNGEHPYQSFQPTWDAVIFDYLPYPFQVCSNPGKGDGHTETTAEQCTEKEVHIQPDDVIENIKAMSYMEITGCPEGYPMEHKELKGEPEDLAACKAKCTGKNGDAYCEISVPMEYANRDSSIACIERYLDQQNSASEFGATLLARAFFERCLSFNPFFTGLGHGYSVVDMNVTGTEYIVRGDIALTKLGPAETFVLIEG